MPAKSSKKTFSLISRPKLLALYAWLLRCQMLAEAAPGAGSAFLHAAAAVAVAIDLRPGDTLSSAPRDALPHFIKGAALSGVLQQLRSRSGAALAAQVKAALAAARAHNGEARRKVTAVFCGRTSLRSRAMKSALRTASAERLPIIFVHCADADLAAPAAGKCEFGLPAIAADRDDLVALYRVASEAIAHARRGNGPTLVECAPWQPARAKGSRGEACGAVANMERYLAQAGISSARRRARTVADFERELRTATVSAGQKGARASGRVRV